MLFEATDGHEQEQSRKRLVVQSQLVTCALIHDKRLKTGHLLTYYYSITLVIALITNKHANSTVSC